jgi:hypothetical protein
VHARPFSADPFRLQMGLRSLDIEEWIQIDELRAAQLAQKRSLIAADREAFVQTIDAPEAHAASAELLDTIGNWCSAHDPDRRPGSESGKKAGVEAANETERSAIARCTTTTQEDWCLIAPLEAGGQPVLVSAGVCFPTRWRLREKMGRTIAAIHEPVTGYREQLAVRVDNFVERLTVDRPVWRSNWNLVDDPSLSQPEIRTRSQLSVADVPSSMFLRIERQTLRRLERTGAVAFGIRVHQEPLASLADDRTALADLLAAVDQLPAETARHKGLDAFGGPLREWLELRLASGLPSSEQP